MVERAGQFRRSLWLLVAGLFAGIFYSIGFNVGCEEGEGRVWRRHMQRLHDAPVQHVGEGPPELSVIRPIEDAPEQLMDAKPASAEAFADAFGRSIQPCLSAPRSRAGAF